jgi:hypothetical protein
LSGVVHHAFFSGVKELIEKYPLAKKDLELLLDKKHLELKNGLFNDVVKKLESRAKRTTKADNKKQLTEVTKKLKKLSFRPVFFETFVRTKEQREGMIQAKEERIELYHTEQREFSYSKTYDIMTGALASEGDWALLAFGLALASGRRCAEIVCDFDGKFKSTRNKKAASFTTSVKTKEPKTFIIPLLVDFDVFVAALDRLRSIPRIKNLIDKVRELDNSDKRHRTINASIQQQLNERTKEVMEGRKLREGELSSWVFKDSRAMYARIAFAEYVAKAKKEGKTPVVDDYFFKKNLGHTDATSQQNYKQFTLTDADALTQKDINNQKKEAAATAAKVKDRYQELEKLFQCKEVQERRAFVTYAEWTLEQVKENPSFKISSTAIKGKPKKDSQGNTIKIDGKVVMESGLGGNKGIIAEFVRLVKAAGLESPL